MRKTNDPVSKGRLGLIAKALWDLYWSVIVPGAVYFDGWLKDRKRRKQKEKEDKPPKEEHPRTARLRRQLERDRKEREDKRQED